MFKDCDATSIGNTSDAAPLEEWLQTVEKVEKLFPEARIVVPGHGKVGGKEIFNVQRNLLGKQTNKSRL